MMKIVQIIIILHLLGLYFFRKNIKLKKKSLMTDLVTKIEILRYVIYSITNLVTNWVIKSITNLIIDSVTIYERRTK